MKNIIKKYIAFGIGLISMLLIGCHDNFLEEDPVSLLSPQVFPASAEDADLILGGISQTLASPQFFNRALIMLSEISSDETVVRYPSGIRYAIDQFNFVNSNRYITEVYQICYQIINQSNLLIASLPNEEWAEPYNGSARFYRAMMYSYLVRLYGPAFLIDKPTETVSDDTSLLVRSPEEEVFNFIVNDLIEAEKTLPVLWSGNTGNDGRPTLGAAKMLLAKMYLSMAGWPVNDSSKWNMAKGKAQEVIDLGIYDLWDDFSDAFKIPNQNGKEAILTAQMPVITGMITVQSRPTGGGIKEPGWYLWQSSKTFMDTFDDADERKSSSFLTEFVQDPHPTIPYTLFSHNTNYGPTPAIAKYQDVGRENFQDNRKRTGLNIPVFRLAEAYLILAEAENEANGATTIAHDAINELRTRAGVPEFTGLSTNALRDAIRQEWSFELAFELKRKFNLLRWGTIDAVLAVDERASNGYAPFKKYYPIPQSEFDRGLPPEFQNDGY
ncbi:RagB/SusD family nutrient uptake outer membrane protein [Tamlana sp. 2201CG12-4]|uniref:RagB/SusD family nutrient uptake outer membrane protein n=1 Tax=Tamlana sp. 2201CG12-4 TaxID=3112582 RepID=UPI002DBE2334|nr:RagB/SusD family nutrient uptake outer membrane protein [Tamlana sp. 2201CG12-4]MEC3907027.1 RagB/SusD family nutrient uptake outer membrane protein [Tamlana sp. 2201CG12-4]